jgi:hypothetical protein
LPPSSLHRSPLPPRSPSASPHLRNTSNARCSKVHEAKPRALLLPLDGNLQLVVQATAEQGLLQLTVADLLASLLTACRNHTHPPHVCLILQRSRRSLRGPKQGRPPLPPPLSPPSPQLAIEAVSFREGIPIALLPTSPRQSPVYSILLQVKTMGRATSSPTLGRSPNDSLLPTLPRQSLHHHSRVNIGMR